MITRSFIKKSALLATAIAGVLYVSSLRAAGTTYYIDFVNGVDTNNGTTKATPWKHAPGMLGCASACNAKVPGAGDQFILKGGVTWPNASLGWQWSWNGSGTTSSPGCAGSGCIYIGVDQTWFTGASWARPILNGGGAAVAAPPNGVANVILRLYASYVIVDNIEFTGVFWTGIPAFGTGANIQIAGGTPGVGTNLELKNLYIHGWSHGTVGAGTSENPCGIVGDTGIPNNNVNTIIHDSVIDGSDTDKASCSAIFGSPPIIQHNFLNFVSSGAIINGTVLVDGNTITNIPKSFDPNAHTNGVEINATRNVTISNNFMGHLGSGTLAIWCAPDATFACTIFNNVIFDTDTGNVLDLAAPGTNNGCANNGTYCLSGGSAVLYNNTVECGPDSGPNAVCAAGINSAMSAVTLENNHFITNATSPNNGVWSTNGPTPTLTTNILQNKATANTQGYTSAQASPFSPTTGGATITAGTNLTSLCSSIPGLCQDSSIGVTMNATNHTVVSPQRTPAARPSSGAWDVGAYRFSVGGTLSAPTNLRIVG